MKAQKKLTVGIAVAIIAVIVASQSVNQAAVNPKVKHEQIKKLQQVNSEEDIKLLMNANHWTRQEAEKVLDLSAEAGKTAR